MIMESEGSPMTSGRIRGYPDVCPHTHGIQLTLHDVFIHEGPFVTNNTRYDHDVPKSPNPDFRKILSTTP